MPDFRLLRSRLSGLRCLSATLLVIYFVVMFPLLDRLEQRWEYGSYIFEGIFVATVWVVFRPRLSFKIPFDAFWAADVFGMLAFGFVIFQLAGALSLPDPFDLRSRELLAFLFVIGPLTEELVFRGALWELLSRFIPRACILLILTTAIFSFAHFFAWWSVPTWLHGFVIYQSVYTIFLGAYCGLRRMKTRSIAVPILAHVAFNFGFYLGFRL